ncbi:D-aminopeptidase [Catalinimonas alkaloidigena]|uniref:D-aminopeptidase n=1 Tax=Catalinimonas alkaloidigena TaxID=1075417 RepID=A0A1G9AYN2_9BACT|nr:P1 family peptidase [Catalinimonas alkaloidigena]SDK31964.1 D-aminopeptidase [Catalinimonas alkaloidigena]
MRYLFFFLSLVTFLPLMAQPTSSPRAREAGVDVGILPPGPLNAITDVRGVLVGHQTVWRGDSVRTGVTVIKPHAGNVYQQKVPAAIHLGNAFGKLAGSTQLQELGNLETPIALTNTLSVAAAVRGLVNYTLAQPGNEAVRSVNAVAGETNDGYLNDIRGMHVQEQDVLAALQAAKAGPVEEGAVGAGTGTVCYGFKGGIGTASRKLPDALGGYTVGVLVQSNFGGILTINGAPVGRELDQFWLQQFTKETGDGSCMMIVATDAPLSPRNLERLAKRAPLGLARTGSVMSNGSGDFVIAFSTAYRLPHDGPMPAVMLVGNDDMSPLFLAVVEATEEAVYNSLFKAKTVTGHNGRTVEALPIDPTLAVLRRYNLLHLHKRLPGIPPQGTKK